MLTRLRMRFGIPGVIAVFALVFAMVGGAYAAKKYVITSTSQIKPSVLKQLKGSQGSAGAAGGQGAAGTAGSAGPAGTAGSTGPTGKIGVTGPEGPEGEPGPEGEEGEPGPEGSPWTAGGTLPTGKTETGSWAAGPFAPGQESAWVPISFPIPLAQNVAVHYIGEEAPATVACPSVPIEIEAGLFLRTPKAAPGNLCVYFASGFGLEFTAEENPETAQQAAGAGKSGANLFFSGEEFSSARGDWAVTAP